MASTAASPPIYALENVSVGYGARAIIQDLDFHIGQGEAIALLGDNGAGKSTLVKFMSGLSRAMAGRVIVDGSPVEVRSRADSAAIGIETIYQDTAMVDGMSIMRNMFMGREVTDRLGFMKMAEMRSITTEMLKNAVDIGGIDSPDKLVGSLSGGQKQAVAIARAVWFKRRILLLDEPTSALSVRETERLLAYIGELKAEGISSVLVTHNLHHAFDVCDRFVVLSHGRKVLEVDKKDTNVAELTKSVVAS